MREVSAGRQYAGKPSCLKKDEVDQGRRVADSFGKSPGKLAGGFGEEKVDVAGVAFLKAGFAVTEVVFPGPAKGIVVTKGDDFLLVFLGAEAPSSRNVRA